MHFSDEDYSIVDETSDIFLVYVLLALLVGFLEYYFENIYIVNIICSVHRFPNGYEYT